MLLQQSRRRDVFLFDPWPEQRIHDLRDRDVANENRSAPFMDGRTVDVDRPPLRLRKRCVTLVLREGRFRRSDVLVPGGDGRRRQFGSGGRCRLNDDEQRERPCGAFGEHPSIGREIVDDAEEDDRNEVAEHRTQSESRRQKYRHGRVADERGRSIRDVKAEQPGPAPVGIGAVAPGPPLMPEEVGQDRCLHGDQSGAREWPVGSQTERSEDHSLHQESDHSDADERECPGIHAALDSVLPAGSGSARYSARVFRIEATPNAINRPIDATTPPMSKSLSCPSEPNAAQGDMAARIAPMAITMRSSVGPKPKNDMRKTPAACVARYDSAETTRNSARAINATTGLVNPEQAMPANKKVVPATSMM